MIMRNSTHKKRACIKCAKLSSRCCNLLLWQLYRCESIRNKNKAYKANNPTKVRRSQRWKTSETFATFFTQEY